VPDPSARAEKDAARLAENVRGHMPVLDGLRGLAVALVVAHNTGRRSHLTSSRSGAWTRSSSARRPRSPRANRA
jgi:hypothetical protein